MKEPIDWLDSREFRELCWEPCGAWEQKDWDKLIDNLKAAIREHMMEKPKGKVHEGYRMYLPGLHGETRDVNVLIVELEEK